MIAFDELFPYDDLTRLLRELQNEEKKLSSGRESFTKKYQESLKTELGLLAEIKKQLRGMGGITLKGDGLAAAGEEIEKLGKKIKGFRDLINSLKTAEDANNVSTANLKGVLGELKNQYEKLDPSAQDFADTQKELAQKAMYVKQAMDAQLSTMKEATKTVKFAENSYYHLNQATGKLRTELKAMPGAFDAATGAINKHNTKAVEMQQRIEKNDKALKAMDASMGQYQRNVGNYRSALDGLGSALVQITGIAGGVDLAVTAITKSFDVITSFDRYRAVVRFASKDTVEFNSNLNFLEGLANKTGTEIETLYKKFGSFAIAGREANFTTAQTRNLFGSIIKAGGALKMSNEGVELSLKAIEQMMSKGKISAEELRQQLGDHLPGAMNLFAKALGVSVEKLGQMMKNGEILSAETLPKFAERLNATFGKEADNNVRTITGSFNRFTNQVKLFIDQLAQDTKVSGFFATLNNFLADSIGKMRMLYGIMTFKGNNPAADFQSFGKADAETRTGRLSVLRKSIADNEKILAGQTDRIFSADQIKDLEKKNEVLKGTLLVYERTNKQLIELEKTKKADTKATVAETDAVKALRKEQSELKKVLEEGTKKDKNFTKTDAGAAALSRYKDIKAELKQLGIDAGTRNPDRTKTPDTEMEKLLKTLGSIQDVLADDALQDVKRGEAMLLPEKTLAKWREQYALLVKVSKELKIEIPSKLKDFNEAIDPQKVIGGSTALTPISTTKDVTSKNSVFAKKTPISDLSSVEYMNEYVNLIKQQGFEGMKLQESFSRSLRGLKKSERDELIRLQQEVFEAQKKGNKDAEAAAKAKYAAEKERILAERDLRRQVVQESFNLAQGLAQSINEIQRNYSDRDIERITKKKDFELTLVGENKEAQKALEEKAAREILEIRRKQAKADKAAALFGIALNTASAVMSVLSTGGGTRFADLGISAGILSALVIAQGLAQAAVVASKPLPEFAKGTQDAPEGPALIAEEGAELRESKGKFYLYDKPSVAHLHKGDKVYTAAETNEMFRTSRLVDRMELQQTRDNQAVQGIMSINYTIDTTAIIEGLGKQFREALANQPYIREVADEDTISQVLHAKNQITKYYKKKHF